MMGRTGWGVLVADDEPAARRGVRQLLAAFPEFAVVGECRDGRSRRFRHLSDEAKSLARQCFDEALLLAGIADRTSSDIQARCQRRIGHNPPIPDGANEVVFGDDALPVADQVFEQVEYLRRDSDYIRLAMQLAPVGVQCVVLEEIAQAAIP